MPLDLIIFRHILLHLLHARLFLLDFLLQLVSQLLDTILVRHGLPSSFRQRSVGLDRVSAGAKARLSITLRFLFGLRESMQLILLRLQLSRLFHGIRFSGLEHPEDALIQLAIKESITDLDLTVMDLASALFGYGCRQRVDLEQRLLVVALNVPMIWIVEAHGRLPIHVVLAHSVLLEVLAPLILEHWLHLHNVLGFKLVQEE